MYITTDAHTSSTRQQIESWQKIVRRYMKPNQLKSYIQIINSFVPYYLSWVIGFYLYQYSLILAMLTAIISSLFLLRVFIVMHDCGHGSFFKSKRKNNFWGFLAGVATFSPYQQWSRAHKIHHQTSGNLDKRGVGDMDLLTVEEYSKLSFLGKLKYKAVRSPFVFLFLGSIFVFMIQHRFTKKGNSKQENLSVYMTNLGILVFALFITYFCGLKFYLFYQFTVIFLAAMGGIFLFYVQHQYENVYWKKSNDWNFFEASMKGSSFLKLPRVLQWVTGNIGFHHIHHLCSSIPNYNLEAAYKENPIFQDCTTIKLKDCFKCLFLNLYDLENQRLISFKEYRKLYK